MAKQKFTGTITGTVAPIKKTGLSNETANRLAGIVGLLFVIFSIIACAVAGFLPTLTGYQ
jgi:hypothetical protein